MKTEKGEVFSLAAQHPPIPGCTVSEALRDGENSVTVFTLADHTDISAELYPYYKLILCHDGRLCVKEGAKQHLLSAGEAILTPIGIPVGTQAAEACVYTETAIRRKEDMNQTIRAGEAFSLSSLVPYQSGKIVNMDVVSNPSTKFVVMAFDAGTGLSEHAAPGEALIFALEGEGIIRYEGQEHLLRAGENFSFARGGMHAVRAEKPFKMALFLTLA